MMARFAMHMEGAVAVLSMQDGENRFNPDFLSDFLEVLDRIEKGTDARALVVTSAHEKIFSNGIDLEWLAPVTRRGDMATLKAFFERLNALFERLLLYPMPTVAAISGHAFAGGAIISCAYDFRFMRSDRGFFCFPEVDLGIPFFPGMIAMIQKAIPAQTFHELQLTGRRVTAEECVAQQIVMKACPGPELLREAVQFAQGLNKRRAIVAEMKKRACRDIIRVMREEDPAVVASGAFHF